MKYFWLLFLFSNSLFSQTILSRSFVEYQIAQANTPYNLKWKSIGPTLNGARAESIQAHPAKPGTFYVAFGSGNLWRTENHGVSWHPVFQNQSAPGIGDIAIAPSDPNVIYVGTGESLRKRRNFTMPGDGVYQTRDGGNSWKHVGLDNVCHIGEISVHPKDPSIVFVAAMGKFWSNDTVQGIYRSLDSGGHWEKVLYVNDKARAIDVEVSRANPKIIYATFWEYNVDTTVFESVSGPTSGIYKSEDGGNSWQKCTVGLPTGAKIGRIGIALSQQDPKKVYALIDNHNNKRAEAPEIYRSVNGGQTWQKTHGQPLYFASVIGWYFSDIYVNPQDDDEIYALGVRLAHSSDGGKTFQYIGGEISHIVESPAQTLHLDHCELWIDPTFPSHLLLANDGGVYQSYDKGHSWIHYNNIPTGEFYHLAAEQDPPYRLLGGTQDDATVIGTLKPNSDFIYNWKYLWIDAWSGGDGCISAFDPFDKNIMYFSMQEGATQRLQVDNGNVTDIRPKVDDTTVTMKYNFVAPYLISTHDSATIYQGGNYILKSIDSGDTWSMISPDLAASTSTNKKSIAVASLAESPSRQGLLFAGTDCGTMWMTKNDGKNWNEISGSLPEAYIRSICASRFNQHTVYIAMTGLNFDDLNAYLFKSESAGQDWIDISSNLPNEPVNVVLEDPFVREILYVGTMRGVYLTVDNGNHWYLLGKDMPSISVADLKIIEDKKLLIAATHGRGLYAIDLKPLYNTHRFSDVEKDKLHLLEVSNATTPKTRSTHKDVDIESIVPQSLYYWLPADGAVSLELRQKDQVIWNKNIKTTPGLNEYVFDLIVEEVTSDQPYYIHYKKYVSPGDYRWVLKYINAQSEQNWIVEGPK